MFDQAVLKEGELAGGEIFYYVPALIIGGTENIDNVQKGDARVHPALLFNMGL